MRREILEVGLLLCHSFEYETHFRLCEPGLHCVSIESVLLAQFIGEKSNTESHEARVNYTRCYGFVIWTIHSSIATGICENRLNFSDLKMQFNQIANSDSF